MTDYRIRNHTSLDPLALTLSDGEAIDIVYDCPKCGENRFSTWLHPDLPMAFIDDCCLEEVIFYPME